MNSKMASKLTVVAATALGLTLAGAAQAEEWRFALEEIQGSVQDAYAQRFKELIEEKSNGEITVEVYPYGTLGTSGELTELAVNGVVQFANASPGHLGTLVPEVQVFSVPYLLSENNEVNKQVLAESETIYGPLAESLEQRNLKLLTMYPEGEMVWTANREIRSPEDLSGFKMRTMVSPMLTEAYSAMGASPTPLPYGEVYGALQLGMVDGQVNPIFAIEEMKFYEVNDYMIWAGEYQFVTTVVTSADWFNGLPEDQQQMIQETVAELTDHIFEVQEEFNEERLEVIKQDRPDIEMIELTDEEREPFRERAQQARQAFIDMTGDSGQQILESLEAEIQAAEEEMG